MTQDIIPFPKTDSAVAQAVSDNVVEHYQEYGQKGVGGFVYGKFVKGVWELGAEAITPRDDELFAVNPLSIQKGAICWKDSRPADEVMFTVASGTVVDMAKLPDHGPYKKKSDGWAEQASVNIKSMDSGLEIILKGSSRGFLQMIYKISGAFASQVKSEGVKGSVIPLVLLTVDDYKHDEYGKVFVPVMAIQAWATEADLLLVDDVDERGEDPAEPNAKVHVPVPQDTAKVNRKVRS